MQLSEIAQGSVVRAPPDATVFDVCTLMEQQNVGCVVIADGEKPVGIVTDRDIMLRVVLKEKDPRSTPISESMTRNPVVFPDTTGAAEAFRTWKEHNFRRVPLVDADGRISGIVSLDDLVQLVGEEMTAVTAIIQKQMESAGQVSRRRGVAESSRREAEAS